MNTPQQQFGERTIILYERKENYTKRIRAKSN